jgi:hypothetical protein
MFYRIFGIILFIFNKKRDSERVARVSESAVVGQVTGSSGQGCVRRITRITLIARRQHQNRLRPLDHWRKIPANKYPPTSTPFFPFSPSLLLSPLSTFGHKRSRLAAVRQLCVVYAFIDNSIFSSVHFTNNFLTFFYIFLYTRRSVNARIHLLWTSPSPTQYSQWDGLCTRGQPPPSRG